MKDMKPKAIPEECRELERQICEGLFQTTQDTLQLILKIHDEFSFQANRYNIKNNNTN